MSPDAASDVGYDVEGLLYAGVAALVVQDLRPTGECSARHEDHLGQSLGRSLLERFEQVDAGEVFHHDIAVGEIEPVIGEKDVEALPAVEHGAHLEEVAGDT